MIIQENYKLAFDGIFIALSDETRVGFLPPGFSVFSKFPALGMHAFHNLVKENAIANTKSK